MGSCYSHRQFCSLGPIPPRTPGRADAQVPKDRSLGACRHGKIGAFYFYEKGSNDDPAFGFVDIEVSIQSISPEKVRVEVYCVADGYQTSRGIGAKHPLKFALMHGEKMLAAMEWAFADVICGHADPMNHSTDIELAEEQFRRVDRIDLMDIEGLSAPCE